MQLRMTTCLGLKAETGGDTLPIVEALFDPRTGALRFLVLDVGSWFHEVDVLVAVREMGGIDIDAGTWHTDLSHDAIEEAPRWSDRASEMTSLPLEHWPPLIVGPFGATYSPLMLEAQAAGAMHSEPTHRVSKVQGLDTISSWRELTAFGEDGELGRVADFVLDTQTMILSHVIISTGGTFSKKEHVLPFDEIRHRAEGQDYVVLHAHPSDLEKAPAPRDMNLSG